MVASISKVLAKAVGGERLTAEEGLALLESHDLTAIGRAADLVTRRLHPESYRTYNIDRNVNYTNVCSAVCDFCAFYRKPKHPEGYVLDKETIYQKIEETIALGGDQILMQGGMNPELPLEWYEDMLRSLKERFPQVNLHAFFTAGNLRAAQTFEAADSYDSRTFKSGRPRQPARRRR